MPHTRPSGAKRFPEGVIMNIVYILIAILILKPNGLFGKKGITKV